MFKQLKFKHLMTIFYYKSLGLLTLLEKQNPAFLYEI